MNKSKTIIGTILIFLFIYFIYFIAANVFNVTKLNRGQDISYLKI